MRKLVFAKRSFLFLCQLMASATFSIPTAGIHFIPASAIASQQNEATALAPGAPVEREISGRQTHTYRINLATGQFIQASVQQQGVEVIVSLLGPDGQKLNEFDEPVGESANREIVFITQSDGDYQFVVRPSRENAPVARYRIKVEIARPATEQDRVRARATQLVKEARMAYWKVAPLSAEEAENFANKFEEALRLWQSLDDGWMVAETLLDLGILKSKRFEYSGALELYDKALQLFPETPEGVASKATTLNNIADIHHRLGEPRKALDYFLRSLELKKPGRSRAISLDNIGGVYYSLSDYQQALDHIQQALAIFRTLGNPRDEAVALNNLANVWGKLGDLNRSLEYLNQALVLIRKTKDKSEEAGYLYNAGNCTLLMGAYEQALEYARQSIGISRDIKSSRGEADGLTLLCNIYAASGESGKALEACNDALPMHRKNRGRFGEYNTLTTLSRLHQQNGAIPKAVELRQAALALNREIGDPGGELSALHALGKFALHDGDLIQARNHIEQAIKIGESLRAKVGSHQLRSSYMAGLQGVFESYVDILMRLNAQEPGKGYEQMALQFSERARARGLLDMLAEARAEIRQGADQELLEKERSLLERINAKDAVWKRFRNNERTKSQADAVANEINDLTTQLRVIEAKVRSSSPRFAALTQPEPLTTEEIQQQALDENTVLLEYALGEKQSWLWAVTRGSISSYKLPPRVEINTAARNVYEMLTARQPQKDMTEAEQLKRIADADAKLQAETAALSRMLLGPISVQLRQEWKDKRLAVVASGALEYVPFAALPLLETDGQRDGETVRQRDGETERQRESVSKFPSVSPSLRPSVPPSLRPSVPLMVDHEVVSLPSASALAVIRHEAAGRQAAAKALAVLADPVFETSDPRLTAARKKASATGLIASARSAGSSSATPLAPSELARSARSFHRDGFGRLVFSNEEAEFITRLAPRNSTLKATGFEANRQLAASGELGRYRIVHFATHGLINSEYPELSGLVLSLVDENGKPQDGFLRMHEIFNLRLPADLVVLSACQTALGKEIKGEGLVGLTRGFMYAGAERVVASLWQVDDRATAQLMRHFYRGMLKENLRPAAALRAAQIEMSRSSRWSSPYYWAGFVIQGEWK